MTKSEPNDSPIWFARVPKDVVSDERLTLYDVRVYCGLALYARKNPTFSVGLRWLSESCHVSIPTIRKSVKRLCTLGHVKTVSVERGKRQVYEMTSPVFAQKEKTSFGRGGKSKLSKVVLQARQWAKNNDEREQIA